MGCEHLAVTCSPASRLGVLGSWVGGGWDGVRGGWRLFFTQLQLTR